MALLPLNSAATQAVARKTTSRVKRTQAGIEPRTPFNRPIGPHRKLAVGSASLDTAKAIKNTYGTTVNDVVLAVCAGGLRTWLARHD